MVRAVGVEVSPRWAVREDFQEEATFEQRRCRGPGRGKDVFAKAGRSGPDVHKELVGASGWRPCGAKDGRWSWRGVASPRTVRYEPRGSV